MKHGTDKGKKMKTQAIMILNNFFDELQNNDITVDLKKYITDFFNKSSDEKFKNMEKIIGDFESSVKVMIKSMIELRLNEITKVYKNIDRRITNEINEFKPYMVLVK